MNSELFWRWVNERHAIYIRKSIRAGVDPGTLHVPPDADLEECDPEHFAVRPEGLLTADPALAAYSFCNVFRELDRVTQWIDRNIRQPFADHPDLWLMLAVARTINWPGTLQFLMNRGPVKCDFNAWPNDLPHLAFSPEALGDALDHWSALGQKVYTGAYMIRAASGREPWGHWTKQQYIARIVIGRLWVDRARWRNILDTAEERSEARTNPAWPTLEGVWQAFQEPRYIGWGPFMAYQVVVDMRHTRYLRRAKDINTWAALGPGSRRGLNRLAGRPLGYNLRQADGLEEMKALWAEQDAHRAPWVPPIELSDIQNCLCETDKWIRATTGEGRPRSKYAPGRNPF
jgi:hypothetical protein